MKCCATECTADAAHSMWVKGDPHTEWRVCSEHIEDEAETVVPYPYNHEPATPAYWAEVASYIASLPARAGDDDLPPLPEAE